MYKKNINHHNIMIAFDLLFKNMLKLKHNYLKKDPYMTYCVAAKLEAGMVFLSDSRTNAGVDAISTFRKMTIFERPNDRVVVMMTAGNLAISQAVRHHLSSRDDGIWQVSNMFDAARLVGDAIRHVYDHDADNLKHFGIDFNVSIILGGQIKGEGMRLFMIYSAGNFIEATDENCFFQIGHPFVFGYDKVIAVHRTRHSHFLPTSSVEL